MAIAMIADVSLVFLLLQYFEENLIVALFI